MRLLRRPGAPWLQDTHPLTLAAPPSAKVPSESAGGPPEQRMTRSSASWHTMLPYSVEKKLALFEAFFYVRSGKGVSQHYLYSSQALLYMMVDAMRSST